MAVVPRAWRPGFVVLPDRRCGMDRSGLKHFRVSCDARGVVTVTLDISGRAYNVLGERVLAELQTIVAELEHEPAARLLLFRSGKESGFITGGDLREISAIRSWQTADQIVTIGQKLFDRLGRLPMPTIAVIHGPCLGGGLELAMACRCRVARDDASTWMSMPEVKLGLMGRNATSAGTGGVVGRARHALDRSTTIAAAGRRDWIARLRLVSRGVFRRPGAVCRRSARRTTMAAAATASRGATS